MKRILTIFVSVILGGTVFAASPLYFNAGVVTNTPQIDATNFFNVGTFTTFTSELPYSTRNTRYFTNRGVINGSVGFQFDTVLDTLSTPPRRPLVSFFNANGASIIAEDSGVTAFITTAGNGSGAFGPSFLKVAATNLVNHGALEVGTVGLMQLTGKSIDLSRGSIAAGQAGDNATNIFFNNNFFFLDGRYVNPYGVEDIYWGAGPFMINVENNPNFFYFPPNGVLTPDHLVQVRSSAGVLGGGLGTIGFIQNLPTTSPANFQAFAEVNQFGTNIEIQVVFLKTNFTDTNITAEVRFGSSGIPLFTNRNRFGLAAMVAFSTPEFDPVSGQTITNSVYFIDGSAEATNIVLSTNALSINSYSRPSRYEIDTFTPPEWLFAQPPNSVYDPSLISPGNTYVEKDGIDAFYGAYSAKIGRNPESLAGVGFNANFLFNFGFFDDTFLLFPDPTNQPGRIEIKADVLDLTLSRIRTEGLLSLNAKHLKGGGAADVSAGIINADLGSTNGSMVISNIFPSHFKRVRGDLFAWSAIWINTETNDFATNTVYFHVLVLDHDLKADFIPTVRNLTLRSTNLFIKDDITVLRSARFETENLRISGGVTVGENAINVGSGNLVGVKNLLVESNAFFQGANNAFFGFDTEHGFDSITNRGTISATAPLFKATRFENSGTISAVDGGSVIIQANTANLSNGKIFAERDVQISAGNVTVTNSILTAGQGSSGGQPQLGQLVLNVTNLLSDAGFGSSNVWQVTDGFILPRKPLRGDLLGTEIRTIASGFQESQHLWPGNDVGPGPNGYNNNLALGHLILDLRSSDARLRFTGAGSQNALYVVTLDFDVGPLVDINASISSLLAVDNNIRIYYINSNAGDKLSAAFPDRIIRVDDFGLTNGTSALVVKANGLGKITPNLDGKNLKLGAIYKMKATPGAGNIFAGWTGSTNSSSALLQFKMRRNMVLEANFVRNPFDAAKGSYNGLFSDATSGIKHESSGFISFNVGKKGAVTGQLLSGKAYRFSGALDSLGHASNISVIRKGTSALTLDLQLDLANNSDEVHGTVTDGSWTATFAGGRGGSGSVQAGQYTMVIAGKDFSTGIGDGFGTISVDGGGHLRFKGTLADGTKINQQASVYKNGHWPFYVPLYKGEGSVLSLITFTSAAPTTLGGDASWIKTGSKGFTNLTTVVGSHYTLPSQGGWPLEISGAVVVLRGGNLSAPMTNSVSLEAGNILTTGTNRLNISISLPNGFLNGNFVHPDTKARTPIKGVVLQQQNKARGFFFGTNQSGSVLLESN